MKTVITTLLILLPLLLFAQLGKTHQEIEKSLGENHSTEILGEGYINYHYDYDFLHEGRVKKERYTFTFKMVYDELVCTNWMIVRPLDTLNSVDESYWDFEDNFKLRSYGFMQTVDKSTMLINLFRGSDYYFINVSYKTFN